MWPNVLLVAHDAGGAEILCAWCKEHQTRHQCFFALAGPARRIFRRDMGEPPLSGLEVMQGFGPHDFVLTGTSLEADLERRAIRLARQAGVRCVSFLDHWDLYAVRFRDAASGAPVFPDEIWLGDDYAWDFALKDGLPRDLLRRVDNPYFAALRRHAAAAPALLDDGRLRLLFICEPVSRKLLATFGPDAKDYDDELANLGWLLQAASAHREAIAQITLRLHPAEPPDKYQGVAAPYWNTLPLAYSTEISLLNDLLAHSHIVGMESMALAIGVIMGRRVISCITGKAWPISLPHREIVRITDYRQLFE
jgi:hypothetical protein